MDAELAGKTVLITGAAGGIGAATARAFAAEGARLALHCNTSEAAARALASELPTDSCIVRADLRDEAQTDAAFSRAIESLGPLHSVIVNAGVWVEAPAPLHRMTLNQWRSTLDADLTSAFLTCRAFLRTLAASPRESANIVFVSSTAGLFGEENHADYAAAKSAMAYGLTLTLKNEIVRLAPKGRVNCVCPGWVRTPMAESALKNPDTTRRVFATASMRKVATPEDIARAIVFLASDALAGHITGAVLPIAGGMEGRLLHDPSGPI